MVVISVYTYGVKIIKKFRWESGFLWGGSMEPPPLCTNGSAGYLMQLSVNPKWMRTNLGATKGSETQIGSQGVDTHKTHQKMAEYNMCD